MTASVENTFVPEAGPPGRWHFNWVLPALFQPRRTFQRIASMERGLVSTPLLLLALFAIASALVRGTIREAALASGQMELPPGWEFYTPEMQAQFQQAMTATSGPVFVYLLPAIVALLGVIVSWVVVGWLLHLLLTLMGGRTSSQQTLNVVAWASLPFILRAGVRIAAMLASGEVVAHPGLSGFVSGEAGTAAIFSTALLSQVDLYLLWHIVLLIVGVGVGNNLSRGKIWIAVLFTVILVMLGRTVPALIAAQFGDLTIVRPFF